jgi:hypothetical protein
MSTGVVRVTDTRARRAADPSVASEGAAPLTGDLLVAAADGTIDPAETSLLNRMFDTLGLDGAGVACPGLMASEEDCVDMEEVAGQQPVRLSAEERPPGGVVAAGRWPMCGAQDPSDGRRAELVAEPR